MLDTETKRRIDSCRDILVGKVPDPKSQVEQITIALIYKFMDDMDAEAEELGGKRKFFAGEFAKYGWAKLMAPSMGGHEVLGLYAEAIAKMNENPGVPALFRDIFKNAYLPYRDPETLKSFLKEINVFSYDHSEKLGDAFEYLLSVLGSQGDAGQFRTPRHIIDFMVELMDPKKDETILDPACGTAGFLISAYKHILTHNTRSGGRPGDLLKTDERKRLAKNIHGYDISPDMVRLSLANLYLHGFANPRVEEYDTLTSDTKWNECADVILANPPFMSPKGGIKPHNKFSVQATRSEVLFVDYIAEHLTPGGRAAIVVPEGIIFQSQTAYKKLREMLVKNSLMAVISLPAGVFQPYSGVKTSILILDKRAAKTRDEVLFLKVENDGFSLGAQRREVKGSDLPGTCALVKGWLSGEEVEGLRVLRSKILESGDIGLSGERYAEGKTVSGNFPMVALGEVCEVVAGQSPEGDFYNDTGAGMPFYQGKTEFSEEVIGAPKKWTTQVTKVARRNDILMSVRAPVGPVNLCAAECCIGRGLAAIRPKDDGVISYQYVFRVLKAMEDKINGNAGATFASINKKDIEAIQIPLPPLSIQREIVAEIEGYQKVIDGARMVVENWKPRIEVKPEWEVVELGDVCEITSSKRIFAEEYVSSGTPFYRTKEIVELNKGEEISLELFIPQGRFEEIKKRFGAPKKGEILLSAVGTIGVSWVISDDREFYFKDGNLLWLKGLTNLDPYFLKCCLDSTFACGVDHVVFGAAYKALTIEKLKEFKILLPSLAVQQSIVAEIQAEQSLVNSTRELITRFEQKIQSAIARAWGVQKEGDEK